MIGEAAPMLKSCLDSNKLLVSRNLDWKLRYMRNEERCVRRRRKQRENQLDGCCSSRAKELNLRQRPKLTE
jgi:hypothetical protein